jgi:hypothetical protein
MPSRDIPIACWGGTLPERYENNVARMERIARAGHNIEVKWECELEPTEDIGAEDENCP